MVQSHGDGKLDRIFGEGTVIEYSAKLFNQDWITIGQRCYIGHDTILKANHLGEYGLFVGNDCWIGEKCYLNAAGGITIDNNVGIGPCVTMLTSEHDLSVGEKMVMSNPIVYGKIVIGSGADVGAGSIILPGVRVGHGAVIGAGSVVTKDVPSNEIWCGNPARLLRKR